MVTQSFSERVRYVDLSPELAKELLAQSHPNQRPISKSWVQQLSNAIRSGDFIASQQTLQVDENGKFFNGQHTCWAVLETGQTLRHIKLEEGCNTNSFVVADSGQNRTNVHRFKAATGETLAPSILSILKVINSNWSAASQSSKDFRDPYQRKPIALWDEYKNDFLTVFGLTSKGTLQGFKKQPLAGVAAAAILAYKHQNVASIDLYRWVHIATTGQAPASMDQSLSATETATASRWFIGTTDPNFDSRDTMNHFRRACYGIHQYINGNTPKSLKRVATNPLLES